MRQRRGANEEENRQRSCPDTKGLGVLIDHRWPSLCLVAALRISPTAAPMGIESIVSLLTFVDLLITVPALCQLQATSDADRLAGHVARLI